MKGLHTITFGLLIIGGLNWGLEFFGIGIANYIGESVASIIYLLVGISALVQIFTHKSYCRYCNSKGSMPQM